MTSKNKLWGITSAALSAISFGFSAVLCKAGYDAGWNESSFTCCGSIFACIVVLIICRSKKISLKLNKKELLSVILASVLAGGTMLLYNLAAGRISSGSTTALHYLYPALIVISSIAFFSAKAGWMRIASAVMNILGVFCFFEKSGNMLLGSILAIASAVCYSAYSLLVENSKAGDLEPFKLTFYVTLGTIAVSVIAALSSDGFQLPDKAIGYIWALFLGLSSDVIGNILYQSAIHNIGASQTSLMSTLEPITSIVFGILLFSEVFVFKTAIGCVLIVIAIILNAVSTMKDKE